MAISTTDSVGTLLFSIIAEPKASFNQFASVQTGQFNAAERPSLLPYLLLVIAIVALAIICLRIICYIARKRSKTENKINPEPPVVGKLKY